MLWAFFVQKEFSGGFWRLWSLFTTAMNHSHSDFPQLFGNPNTIKPNFDPFSGTGNPACQNGSLLNNQDSRDWSTVIFGTLTQPNATPLQFTSGRAGLIHMEAIEQFLDRACVRWRVHLKAHIGWDDTINQHSHILIQVPTGELSKWRENQARFNPALGWRWKRAQIDWQAYDPSHPGDVWSYVTRKHTYLRETRCPKRGPCRRGRCPYRL